MSVQTVKIPVRLSLLYTAYVLYCGSVEICINRTWAELGSLDFFLGIGNRKKAKFRDRSRKSGLGRNITSFDSNKDLRLDFILEFWTIWTSPLNWTVVGTYTECIRDLGSTLVKVVKWMFGHFWPFHAKIDSSLKPNHYAKVIQSLSKSVIHSVLGLKCN